MLSMMAVLLSASVGSLELRVQPLQAEIFVGEPLMAEVTWSAAKHVEVRRPEQLRVIIMGPGGYRAVLEGPSRYEGVRLPSPIDPGSPLVTEVLLLHGDYLSERERGRNILAFPSAGDYAIQVAYDELKAVSKPARVRVVAPEGEEADVFRELYGGGRPYDERRAAALLGKYPHSRYLRMAKLGEIATRLGKVAGGQDPETGQSFNHLSADERRRWQARQVQLALQELESGEWGGWEEERLKLAIDTARGGGDRESAERLEADVLQRLPGSATAQEIMRRRAADVKE